MPRDSALATNTAIVFGALLPDLSLFVMWGTAKFNGIPESTIWSEWYYRAFWQSAGAVTNSLLVYGLLAVITWWMLQPARINNEISNEIIRDQSGTRTGSVLLAALGMLSLAAVLHVVTDFPLHHDDGHPHFWPLSNWVFSSPVSYWDPAHYGGIWSSIELVLALVLVVILCRRYRQKWVRVTLYLCLFTYFAVASYWFFTLVAQG